MTAPLDRLDRDRLSPRRHALFLDLDGTLLEIVERPDMVALEASLRAVLPRLLERFQGGLAIVTGRELDDVDRILDPLALTVAAGHGLSIRHSDGTLERLEPDPAAYRRLEAALAIFVAANPGLILERKLGSLALHYRSRPQLEGVCGAAVDAAVGGLEQARVIAGKKVFEVVLGEMDKGRAIAVLLRQPPFVGRVPIFAGDDRTDEDGFREVNSRGGLSIKIGQGATMADYRAPGRRAFIKWLGALAAADCTGSSDGGS